MRPLIWEDPKHTKQLSPWATAIEPVLKGPGTTITEALKP